MRDAGGAGIVGVIALAPAKLICIYWGGGNPVVSIVLLVNLLGEEEQSCYPLTLCTAMTISKLARGRQTLS